MQLHDQFLLRFDPGRVEIAWLICQAICAWADHFFVIVVDNEEAMLALNNQLHRLNIDAGLSSSRYLYEGRGNRRVAISLPGLGMVPWEQADFVFVNPATLAARNDFSEKLFQRGLCRTVGLLDVSKKPSPWERAQLVQHYSVNELVLPAHGHGEREVQIHTRRFHPMPLPAFGGNVVKLKRTGIWQHPVRNRILANLAKAVSSDRAKLNADFPDIALALENRSDLCALVLVENLEHAFALRKSLKGWPVLCGPDPDMNGIESSNIRDPFAFGATCPAIATFAALEDIQLSEFDCLIRADGGPGVPELDLSFFEAPQKVRQRLLLVDFEDRHHPQLSKWSRRRQKTYAERGWLKFGEDRVAATWRAICKRFGKGGFQ